MYILYSLHKIYSYDKGLFKLTQIKRDIQKFMYKEFLSYIDNKTIISLDNYNKAVLLDKYLDKKIENYKNKN